MIAAIFLYCFGALFSFLYSFIARDEDFDVSLATALFWPLGLVYIIARGVKNAALDAKRSW